MLTNIVFNEMIEDECSTDYIFDCEVTEDFYNITGIDEEENPKDAFTLWCTINMNNTSTFVLCNEGFECDYDVPADIKQQVFAILEKMNMI